MYDVQGGSLLIKTPHTKCGWRKAPDPEKKNLILSGKVPEHLVNRIPLPAKTDHECLLAESFYTGCSYCPAVKTLKEFCITEFKECLTKVKSCRHRQKKELAETLCTLCEKESCPEKKPGLHRNMPVEVSQDGINWIKAHVAYTSKGSLFCYEKGGTSATVVKVEQWKLIRKPVQKHPYRIMDVNALEFQRVHEWGSRVEQDTLVCCSPNFKHPLFYATGNVSEHGVEVYSQGETSYSGQGKLRVILEFPVWKFAQ